MAKHLLFLTILLGINACAKQSKAQTSDEVLAQHCYDERKLESTVSEVSARIETFGDEFLIATDDARYMPCEIPIAFRKNGTKIVFSGDIKEVYAQERWAGLPLHLTKIRLIKK